MKDIYLPFHNKTRVLIFSKTPEIASFFLHLLNFHGKSFDFISDSTERYNSENDFVVLESFDFRIFALFKPNIVLLSSDIMQKDIEELDINMTAGGVLIYPANIIVENEHQNSFYRKLEFVHTPFQKDGDSFVIDTSMGKIPVAAREKIIAEDLKGIQLLAQQFGIMEEEFFESVMEYDPS